MKRSPIQLICTVAFGPFVADCGAQVFDTNNAVVQTFAGSAFYGYMDGVGQQTMFNNPTAIVSDSSSNLFVLDADNARIRKISPAAVVTTFVGGGSTRPPSSGTNVLLGVGSGPMAIDRSNAIWIGNLGALVRVGSDGSVSNVTLGWGVDEGPNGICVDSLNNLYLSSYSQKQIYRLGTNGVLELFVGSGNTGTLDGNGLFCSFYSPRALGIDSADNLYVSDMEGMLVRRINQNRDVTTIAGHVDWSSPPMNDGVGGAAFFTSVSAIRYDGAGSLLLACGYAVRRLEIATTNVTTIAGSFTESGFTNGPGSQARFSWANDACVIAGTIFVADSPNERIRSISFNPPAQVVSPNNLKLKMFAGLEITGTVGRTYEIQGSVDMNLWETLSTFILPSTPYQWIDQNSVSGSRFYRAVLLP